MTGTVTHIHIAKRHGAKPVAVDEVRAVAGEGLEGDRYFGTVRNVTIVCDGELVDAAADLGLDEIVPGSTRRNITVSLDALPRNHGTEISLGEAAVTVWRDCAPCETLESSVGPGAKDALVGRAGISAVVTTGGLIRVGDRVEVVTD
jgi:MOSC domain-containing protein YiiM